MPKCEKCSNKRTWLQVARDRDGKHVLKREINYKGQVPDAFSPWKSEKSLKEGYYCGNCLHVASDDNTESFEETEIIKKEDFPPLYFISPDEVSIDPIIDDLQRIYKEIKVIETDKQRKAKTFSLDDIDFLKEITKKELLKRNFTPGGTKLQLVSYHLILI